MSVLYMFGFYNFTIRVTNALISFYSFHSFLKKKSHLGQLLEKDLNDKFIILNLKVNSAKFKQTFSTCLHIKIFFPFVFRVVFFQFHDSNEAKANNANNKIK